MDLDEFVVHFTVNEKKLNFYKMPIEMDNHFHAILKKLSHALSRSKPKQEKTWFKYQTFNSNAVGYLTHLATKLVLQNPSGDQNWGQ